MGFTEAVRTVLTQKYATFSGRASRSEYWWFQLFYLLVGIALLIANVLINGDIFSRQSNTFSVIGGLLSIAVFVPQVCLQVRRFHDRNISGWWYLGLLLSCIIPFVGIISLPAIFIINLLPGTEGPNKFGADPLRPEVRAEVFA
ncbi:DUF805 domain-containing protein [Rhizobium laguerreae]|uniref:DUF805 domain-containing protein n=1 Tax=Rhizobium laguerreae TaxID=1076926 RepID=UPI001C903B28|nr:DUF805 domain-containing protein [Rhizobium laguerreae]MBY3050112.1 DUF805 domain-containing protein [Rhizobium laguerreae]MBY3195951.1 DUF805 domain-containing protein [Rhizobium laguerreae]MBY3206568.1 DUF805 domain-containing protein [Rhizobium laguerreae]MBY3346783.1 DUF805 domain-containing protein [Rhizobium laguerreae]MBY3353744.1 DUF805 domain-containing protein [Rhizobium laguerreae]